MLVAFAAQGRGHREVSPPRPFRGPLALLARFLVWVTFPRDALRGGFGRAWRTR